MVYYDQNDMDIHSNDEKRFLNMVNEERQKRGLAQLELLDNLTKVSDIEAKSMSGHISDFLEKVKKQKLQEIFNYYDVGYCTNIYYCVSESSVNLNIDNVVLSLLKRNINLFLNEDASHLSFSCQERGDTRYIFCFVVKKVKELNENDIAEFKDRVVDLTNRERAKYNLSMLLELDFLMSAGQIRAREQVSVSGHTRPDGSDWSSVVEINGPYTLGENVAEGQISPEEVVKAWMDSEAHRKNILSNNFNYIGVGVHQEKGKIYWSQIFYGNK